VKSYIGPRYHGHPYLDGRGVFLDGHPLDVVKDPRADADLSRSNPPRTKREHPYNYDPFTIWGQPFPNAERTGTVYADRLMQWDRAKYERLARKHYRSGTADYERPFDSERCQGGLIERFLRDWFEDQELKLLRVVEQCNPYTGERTWMLDYKGGAQ
jgi:hypothetical protein